MQKPRALMACVMLDDDTIFYIGGYDKIVTEFVGYTDLHDILNKKWIILSTMDEGRCRHGVHSDQHMNERINVSGGQCQASGGRLNHCENEYVLNIASA